MARSFIPSLVASLFASVLLMTGSACALDGVKTVRVASGLNLPMFATAPEGDYERLFIIEQRGVIKILNLPNGEVLAEDFLDIDSKVTGPTFNLDARGLLGLAFHPDYMTNGAFFVHYSGSGGDTIISRFFVDPNDPNRADPDSEEVLLTVDQTYLDHKGGTIAFSPVDGYLYLALGDGGSADLLGNDPDGRAQDGAELLGKIIRIDVNDLDSDTYAIPDDNPYTSVSGVRDEIWAFGMRNPYRWSFDRATGDLYIGDVGQSSKEELNFQPADSAGSENYGWCCREGLSGTGLSHCTCPDLDELTDPIVSYSHSSGRCSIIGGYVYRGGAIPSLDGIYFYADWCADDIYVLTYDGATVSGEDTVTADIAPGGGLTIATIVGFGEDGYGELYIVEHGGTAAGQIFKLVPDDIGDFDCNKNYILDSEEIAHGAAEDCDGDGAINACGLVTRLTPSDGAADDEFGSSVAMSSEVLLAGAPADDDAGANSGSAYVYRRDGSTWSEEQKLLAPDGTGGDRFGAAVAIEGDLAVIGAAKAEDAGIGVGAVYLFRYSPLSGEWSEEDKLVASDGTDNAEFGRAVSLSGDVLVVGARLDDAAGSNSGAAYVFRFEGGHWSEERKLLPADLAGFDEFGCAVDVDGDGGADGDAIVVGSRHDDGGDDDGASNAGSAYVFRYEAGEWQQEEKLTAGDSAAGIEFGSSVGIAGNLIVVGCPLSDSGGANTGGMYAYQRDAATGEWGSEQFFQSASTVAGDSLGVAASLHGGALCAGAPLADQHGASSGRISFFYFDAVQSLWVESALNATIGTLGGDQLGSSVAISSSGIAAGAPFGAIAETESGAIYVIKLQDCNTNGIMDVCELTGGQAADCNDNDIPDDCELRFLEQPAAQQARVGETVTFTGVAAAGPAAAYQWSKDGDEIDGAADASLTIDAVALEDAGVYQLFVEEGCLSRWSTEAALEVTAEPRFRRGDVDGNGETLVLIDAIYLLRYGFMKGAAPPCLSAADVNDDGAVSPIQDAVLLLAWGFLDGSDPPAPGPARCGVDPKPDALGCKTTATSCL